MSKKLTLLDDSSDSEVELTINKSYAKSYSQWRNKEELQKYKDLKKEEEDSESSSSESEEEIPEFDEEFFRALSLLKSKDPRLYDKDVELFKNQEVVKKPKAEKQKPVFMKDYERNLVLEKGGQFSDEEDEPTNVPEKIPTYDEEQEKLKKSFKEAVGDLNGSDDEDDADDLLQVRTKTKKEEEDEEKDYIKWLKGEEKEVPDDVKKDMTYLRNYWNDPKLDENEKFLRDYLLNKRYLEKDDSEIPTYEELTSGMLSDDEKMIEEQEKFEHKYNFRFEEPDEDFIKRYPRTVGDSLRRADTRRKQKREEKAERRQKEREQRREELKRLKALKRKEIEEKFLKLKEISGQEEIKLNESDMESDFDPDKHDQKMREMFDDEYYEVEEDKKPEFPYDEELDAENWNAWAGEKIVDDEDDEENEETANEEHGESSQQKLSAREEFANEMINASRPKKKVKKKSLFAKIISQPKPIYDPDGKSFEEYLDEYYKLDYEDVVGDLPVRYKYRKVIPNDFGLTVDEILKADDRELNRWCSVKKTCQYRRDEEELYDVQAFQKKAQNPVAKQKFLPSVYAPKEKSESVVSSNSLNLDGVNNNKTYDSNNMEEDNTQFAENNNVEIVSKEDSTTEINDIKKKRKKKNRKKKKDISVDNTELTTTELMEENGSSEKSESTENVTTQVIDTAMNGSENFDSVGSTSECTVHELTDKNSKRKSDSNRNNSNFSLQRKNNSQCSKRKRDVVGDDSEENDSENDVSQESTHELLPQPNNLPESNAAAGTSDMSGKKKRKKKKNKRKKVEMSNSQGNTSNPNNKKYSNPNRNNDKHKQNVSGDKRLGLSDARLAAYGINPKKFKNKIIYSKK